MLAPGQPGSIELIKQMFTELAAIYPGPFLHIGADETVDLGLGQTKGEWTRAGLRPVYLDFLQRIVTALKPLNRKILFWGDIAQDCAGFAERIAAVVQGVDDCDCVGVQPGARGYDKYLTPFTKAGFETWVAPSVNNFRKVYPDNNLALREYSAVHGGRAAAGVDRAVEYDLER